MDKKQTGIWHPGETVYSHGTPPEYAFLIISGEVQFFSQKKVLLGSAGESEVFGEISCYLNRNHSVSAVARTNLVTKKIHKTELSKIFKNSHPVIMGMLRSTYHRLAEANIKNESSEEEIEKWTLMYQNDIKNSEEIKNKIETIKEKIDNNKG
jgi:CRP-like cAMP-binding protein